MRQEGILLILSIRQHLIKNIRLTITRESQPEQSGKNEITT